MKLAWMAPKGENPKRPQKSHAYDLNAYHPRPFGRSCTAAPPGENIGSERCKACVAAVRRWIWQSFKGCDCDGDADDTRCKKDIVRCNGRLGRIHADLDAAGLPRYEKRTMMPKKKRTVR